MDRAAGPDIRHGSHEQAGARPRRRGGVPPWLTATFAAVFLVVAAVAPIATAATASSMTPACDAVNIRTSASTTASIKVRLGTTATVTVVGTVTGGRWSTYCPGWKSGSTWYRLTHVNGKSVSTLYGVTYLYAATGVLKASATTVAAPTTAPTAPPAMPTATPTPTTTTPTGAPVATPAPTPSTTTMVPACDGVNLRTSTSTTATLKVRLYSGATVGVVGTVSGSAWSTVCGTAKSGSGWYKVSQVNGKSVSSLYGVAYLYAATGILKAAPTTTVAKPTASPTVAPTSAPTAAPATPAPTAPSAPATPAPTPAAPIPAAPTATPAATAAPTSPTTTMAPACDGVNLRTGTSTSSTIAVRLAYGATVGVLATVSGGSWSTVCPTSKSGSGWYRISSVNGTPVSTLYGVSYLYAATGVLGTPPAITPLPASATFYGRGWGHGVGLSQWGAKGRATAGQDAAAILAHYYQGTTIQPLSGAPTVRVLVLNDYYPTGSAPLIAFGRGGEWTVSGIAETFPKDARLRVVPVTKDGASALHLIVDLPATGEILHDIVAPTDFRLESASGATLFELTSKPGTDDLYRGSLRVVFQNGTADVIDSLPLEQYLRGVVPVEMPSSWPLEARKAQAIAARSYAMYRVNPSSGTFDVYDDTRSQVYDGVRGETAGGDAAVSATSGLVLRYGSAIVNAMFHSTGGGATENNEFAFTSSTGALTAGVVAYLRGSSDRDANGVPYDAGATYATWKTDAYSVATLSAIFAKDSRTNVGTLTGLGLTNRGVSGRLISVTLVGSGGSKTVSGNVFTSVFNTYRPSGSLPMRSTLVSLAPIP